ncbi:MAG: SAM-dependent methyltransferase [Tatlockia sp.]|jgi:SAM-dependent MidA family methyltransferase
MHLLDAIRTLLVEKGEIPFAEFMHLALYSQPFGYYSGGLQKFGKEGDFITAPELTPLFGQTLANQCQQLLCALEHPILFEFGAGSGRLAVDLLQALETKDCLPAAYHILEVSGSLRARQEALIEAEIPHLKHRIHWLSRWPEQPFNGVMIANEVLDAMPVHRFLQTTTGIDESFITLNANGELIEMYKPSTNERLIQQVERVLPKTRAPYQSEVNLFIDDWLKQCSEKLQQGAMILIDYGFPRHEYYHPDRNTGTLMAHYQHKAHTQVLAHPGEQDITAHVDFTHVAEAADAAGFHIAGFCNQASFLLANGLLNLLEDLTDTKQQVRAQQAVKQLIQPSEMGELFKVIALTKGIDFDLAGFQLHDKRASL